MRTFIPINSISEPFTVVVEAKRVLTGRQYSYAILGIGNPETPIFPEKDPPPEQRLEEPSEDGKDGMNLFNWFRQSIQSLNLSADEEEQAWSILCAEFDKRMLGPIEIFEATERVVTFPHEVLEVTIRDKTCRLEGKEVLSPKTFQVWHDFAFNVDIRLDLDEWHSLLAAWRQVAEEGELEEAALLGNPTVDSILNYLRTQQPTTTKEDMEKAPMQPYFADGRVLLSNTVITNRADDDGVSMRALHSMMRPYLSGNSRPMYVGKSIQRFWAFDPAKVGVNVQTKLPVESEEDVDNP